MGPLLTTTPTSTIPEFSGNFVRVQVGNRNSEGTRTHQKLGFRDTAELRSLSR